MTYFKTRSWINVDSSHRCPLECPNCQRQTAFTFKGKVVHGRDLKMDEIEKLAKHFKSFVFCGQLSDPIHHPKFPTILNRLHELEIPEVLVHNASTAKPMAWYIKSWKANPNALWTFACDGLPKDSHKYRKNQNGEKMFEIMKESIKHLNTIPIWQFIIFNYNENDIEEAKIMANSNGIDFLLTQSSRWKDRDGKPDPLLPTGKYKPVLRNKLPGRRLYEEY
jgi:MoaA/NifB/PqqE/SkfB family radical SAM enzyme